MGYNAAVVVLLDQLRDIEKDPEFGKKLADAIRQRSTNHDADIYLPGQTQVISVDHADHMQIIAVGGNTGRVLGYVGSYASTDDQIILDLERTRRRTNREKAAIVTKAIEVLGSKEEAEKWLNSPAVGLNQKKPFDLLSTYEGRNRVLDYLSRIEHGVYT